VHSKVSEAIETLVTDLEILADDTSLFDVQDDAQMTKIRQDGKLLDEAAKDWQKASE
jgi:hypothetical protein